MARLANGTSEAARMPQGARIMYGVALEDSSGGAVLVRFGAEIGAGESWGNDGGGWIEVDPAGGVSVDSIAEYDTDAEPLPTVSGDDRDESEEQPPDETAEHSANTAPLDAGNFAESFEQPPAWCDVMLDESAAYTETWPTESAETPADTDEADAANDPHAATIEQ